MHVISPTQRGRTEKKIELYYDSKGALSVKTSPSNPAVDSAASQAPAMPNSNVAGAFIPTYQQAQAKRSTGGRRKVFSLLQAFVRDNALLIILTSYLDIPSIISLYAISKSFHLSFNRHATAFILSSMRTWAPNADNIFPWRCYSQLCIKDPIKRQKSVPKAYQSEIERMGDISRDVPSLRWLQMVVWREAIVSDMLVQLNSKALRCPRGTLDAVKRTWFAMDLPLNAHRLALFRSPDYFPNKAIALATHFFIKVDMALTDPGFDPFPLNHPNQAQFPNHWAFGGAVGCNLREKLVAERNFTSLWRVLNGWSPDVNDPLRPIEQADILKLNVRHNFRYPPGTIPTLLKTPIMGMWYSDFMFVGCERTYHPDDDEDTKLTRPIRPILPLAHLLMGEGVRRDMKLPEQYIGMMASGFFVPGRGNIPVMTVEQQREFARKPAGVWRRQKVKKTETLSAMKAVLSEMSEDDAALMYSKMEID